MTKFIDRTKQKDCFKKTIFKKVLESDLSCSDTNDSVDDYELVEFIGHDVAYRDIFKAFPSESVKNNFTLFFGVKGDEFNNE